MAPKNISDMALNLYICSADSVILRKVRCRRNMADEIKRMDLQSLPMDVRQNLEDIFEGRILPPLYSDVIAKTIFNADVHPERLNFLLRSIAKDNTIDVQSSAANEAFRPSVHSKGIVSDIPSWLRDQRLADLEIQKARQDFLNLRSYRALNLQIQISQYLHSPYP